MAPKNAKLDGDDDGNVQIVKPESNGHANGAKAGDKREHEDADNKQGDNKEKSANEEPPAKAAKTDPPAAVKEKSENLVPGKAEKDDAGQGEYRVLEQGLIYFFYRPKVQAAEDVEKSDGKAADSIDDVQSTHMLLVPVASESGTAPAKPNKSDTDQNYSATTGEKASKQGVGYRLIRLGKKRLPAPEEAIKKGLEPGGIGGDASEAIWSVVSDIGPNVAELSGKMGEQRYNTRTRGQRYVGASRPAGRGRYSVVLHETEPPSSRSVHLAYALSHPAERDMGEVQTELGLAPSGSLILSMRNPTLPQTGQGAPPAGLPEDQRVEMNKKELDDTFGGSTDNGGTRYARPENIELLDRTGVEMLLTRERHQSGAEAGTAPGQAKALKTLADKEASKLGVQDVLKELQLSSENPPDAIEGTWI